MLAIICIIKDCFHSSTPDPGPAWQDYSVHFQVFMIVIIPLLLLWAATRKERGGGIWAEEYSKSEILPTFSSTREENSVASYLSDSNAKVNWFAKALLTFLAILFVLYPFSRFIF